jgi:streptogramin lyase
VDSVRIGGRLNSVIAAGGRVWAGAFRRPRLDAVDPKTVRRVARLKSDIGIGLSGAAVAGDTMWVIVSRERKLLRLDARSGEAAGDPIDMPGIPNAVATDGRTVWVAISQPTVHTNDMVLAYDAATGQLERTLNVLDGVRRLLVAEGGLWMLSSGPARIARVDLRTGKRKRTRLADGAAGDLASGDGSIWVTLVDADQVVRVNPRTWNTTTIAVGREPYGIVSARGFVWVANRTSSTVSRVDPRSSRVRDEIRVPLNPYELDADSSGVWVTSLSTGRVSRITAPARAG